MTTTQKKVLLVSRAFPPFAPSLGGAIRMLKLSGYLQKEGCEVHVLAGEGREYGNFGYEDLLRTITIHYVRDPILANTGPQGSAGQSRSGWRTHLRPLANELAVPDMGIFALPKIMRSASEIICKYGIRNILTSGPPHSDHLVGLMLKRKLGSAINWIVDYRDSWSGTSLFRKRTWPMQRLNLSLEKSVLAHADYFTYISSPMLEKITGIADSGDAVRAKSRLVMNGFDVSAREDSQEWASDNGPLTIGYFGAIDDRIDSYRNPASLFQTVFDFGIDVRFELFGTIRLSQKWQSLLGDRLVINGMLEHNESVRRMRTCDVLLILHTRDDGADEVITGKFFEYLLSGRPILSLGPSQMAVNDLLRELGAGCLARHDDSARLNEVLLELIRRKKRGDLQSSVPSGIERFSRSRQYSTVLDLLTSTAHRDV